MSILRYERYKESGIAWLGDVPEHWNTLPLLAVGRERDERNTGMADSNLLSLSYGRIIRKDINTNEGLLPESFETYQIVHPGDIIFRLTDLQNDKRSLRTAIVEERGIITSAYLALKPFSANPQFLNYVFRAYDLSKVFYAMGSGVRQSMNYQDVKRMEMLLPPTEEQVAIARFLDRETAKIDALIEEQRRLIALLKEKRQAVISHAVTKGLNPSATMKTSGYFWIGDIPAHWEVVGLTKYLLSVVDYRGRTPTKTDEGVFLVTAKNIRNGFIDYETSQEFIDPAEYEEVMRRGKPLYGEVLFTTEAPLGQVALVDREDIALAQRVLKFNANPQKLLNQFLMYWIMGTSCQSNLIQLATGSTALGIKGSKVGAVRLCLPQIEEQVEIAKFIEHEILRIQALVETSDSAVALLQERRSALISSAVTGKINVTVQVAKPVRSTWSTGFARQVLAAETLSRCNGSRMGRIKLQKLIHLCEYHAQLDEVRGTYSRQAAGPFAPQVMEDVRQGLLQQRWFEEYKDESRYAYRALENAGGHKQYLPHWEDKQARIDHVLNLLGGELTRKCEIASTLYAAWNDLLIEGKNPTESEIIHEASSAERWHESKEKIAAEKWPEALKWMRANGLVPVGYGTHTMHQPDLFTKGGHEPA